MEDLLKWKCLDIYKKIRKNIAWYGLRMLFIQKNKKKKTETKPKRIQNQERSSIKNHMGKQLKYQAID